MITVERKKKTSKDKLPVPVQAESSLTPRTAEEISVSSNRKDERARESTQDNAGVACRVESVDVREPDSRGGQSSSTANSGSLALYPNLKPWQPGQSGNPNGRPKILTQSITEVLSMPEEVKIPVVENGKIVYKTEIRTKAQAIALRMADEASSHYRLGCSGAQLGAAEKLRSIAEPTDAEENAGNIDRELCKLVATLLMGNMKPAKAIEV